MIVVKTKTRDVFDASYCYPIIPYHIFLILEGFVESYGVTCIMDNFKHVSNITNKSIKYGLVLWEYSDEK